MTEKEYIGEVERCRDRLVGVANSYVCNMPDAEDVVQDVLSKLWLLHDTLSCPFDAIAFRAVRNKSVDMLRRRQRYQGSDVDIESLNTRLEQMADEENVAIEREERIEQMLSALNKLPSQQNIMLRMRYLKGMDTTDMARATGATEVAIRKTLSRARANLLKTFSLSVVALMFIAVGCVMLCNVHAERQMLKLYEGSYIVVNGHRTDDLRAIRSDIEQTLAVASEDEAAANMQGDISLEESNVLSNIADEAERERIRKLLSE